MVVTPCGSASPVQRTPGSSGHHHNTVVDSFIVKQRSSTEEWRSSMEGGEMTDTNTSNNLPSAILKLDQRLSIPAPMHKNDVLVELEVRDIYIYVY